MAAETYVKEGRIQGTLREDFNVQFKHFGPQTCLEVIDCLRAYQGVIDIELDPLILESFPPGYTWHVSFYDDEGVIQTGIIGTTCYETKKEIKKDDGTSCYEKLRNIGNSDISITCSTK